MNTMNVITEFDTTLAVTIDRLLIAGQFEDASKELISNVLQHSTSDTVAVIVKHLTDSNFHANPDLYVASENLLQTFAHHVKEEEALFELLEIVETTKSDNVFTSTLKALQICIRRQQDRKVRSLEWCLNSIMTYVAELHVPEQIKDNSDAEVERLYEDNDDVRRILTNYITLFLFYEPYLEDVLVQKRMLTETTFRNCSTIRGNVLASFMLQLLGSPLYILRLERPENDLQSNTNTYSWQCASTLAKHWTSLFPNPFFLFDYVERRSRFAGSYAKHPDASVPADIFLLDEKTPLHSIAVLFYLLYSEQLMPETVPKVYTELYQFESVLHLVCSLLQTTSHALHYKALQLCSAVLRLFVGDQRIPASSLDLTIHQHFFDQLIRVITQTASKRNSQLGGQLLRRIIFQHGDKGRLYLITNLLRSVDHNGVQAYVAAMYKDMIAEALQRTTEDKQLSPYFCGNHLRTLLLDHICRLDSGPETDLLKHSDTVITALNVVRFLALSDSSNRTGFWDTVDVLTTSFLRPLRRALELTLAHYRMEERRIADGRDADDVEVGVQLTTGEPMPPIDRDAKLRLVRSAMNTFDLMDSLLGRVDECFRAIPKT